MRLPISLFPTNTTSKPNRRRSRQRRLSLEELEDRTVPTSVTLFFDGAEAGVGNVTEGTGTALANDRSQIGSVTSNPATSLADPNNFVTLDPVEAIPRIEFSTGVVDNLAFDALDPPFTIGGDPRVDPADFRVTTFATGLDYPYGMTQLSDGSILVATSDPDGSSFFSSTGELLRLADDDGNGVADGAGTVLFTGLPGAMTSLVAVGELFFVTSTEGGGERITVLRAGATPDAALTLEGSLNLTFPSGFGHKSYALEVTEVSPGAYDLYFNIGAAGNATTTDPTNTVTLSGLTTGSLQGDSIYRVRVSDAAGAVTASNLVQIATGLRNAAGLAFDPTTGDLYFEDNGIDTPGNRGEALSADELNFIAAANLGGAIEDFGFAANYTRYRTGTIIGGQGIQPLAAFQPLPNPQSGDESEGPAEIALAPSTFGALSGGIFVGFHGQFNDGGLANRENPLVWVDPATGDYFHFIGIDEANVGHLDGLLATSDALFLADLSSNGSTGSGAGAGVIYMIQAILDVNNDPTAGDDLAATNEDTAVTIDVLADDSDIDGDALSVTSATQGADGSVLVNADNTITYTPDADFNGGDSFTYTIDDGNGGGDTATVTISVVAINDDPVARDDSALTNEDRAVTIAVLTNDSDIDGDALSVTSATQGADGSVLVNANNTITYTPDAEFSGSDRFTYAIDDGNGGDDTATVTITVVAINDDPVARDDSAATNEDLAVTIDVLANDSDIEGDALSVTSATQGADGSVLVNADNTITYTPDAAFNGSDSFTYTIDDGNGGTDTATVSVTVIKPQLVLAGGVLRFDGSAFRDVVEVTIHPNVYIVTAFGSRELFSSADVATISMDGNGGFDTLRVRIAVEGVFIDGKLGGGTVDVGGVTLAAFDGFNEVRATNYGASTTARLTADFLSDRSIGADAGSFLVGRRNGATAVFQVVYMQEVHTIGAGGAAYLSGFAGADELEATSKSSIVTGASNRIGNPFRIESEGFRHLFVHGNAGADKATFTGDAVGETIATNHPQFGSALTFETYQRVGNTVVWDVRAFGFENVTAINVDSADGRAFLFDGPEDDMLDGGALTTILAATRDGQPYRVEVQGFSLVVATAKFGGYDVAYGISSRVLAFGFEETHPSPRPSQSSMALTAQGGATAEFASRPDVARLQGHDRPRRIGIGDTHPAQDAIDAVLGSDEFDRLFFDRD